MARRQRGPRVDRNTMAGIRKAARAGGWAMPVAEASKLRRELTAIATDKNASQRERRQAIKTLASIDNAQKRYELEQQRLQLDAQRFDLDVSQLDQDQDTEMKIVIEYADDQGTPDAIQADAAQASPTPTTVDPSAPA